ncbi:MAG TPA: hypothetical protein VK054_01385, partial [Beutenbergiaceae bacterium]|nr:hypothetical protein [Beutenbergiaceae bacterium]
ALHAVITEHGPTLVVIDSTGEAMALDGARPNEDDDTARWFRALPTAIARRGPAVAVLDHVPKANDGALFAIGSQRKRAAITGAQYMQVMVRPFSKQQPGSAKLICAKDRPGNYHQNERVADLHITPTGDGVRLELRTPTDAGDAPTVFRPTALMERIADALNLASEPLTFNRIEGSANSKRTHVRTALDVLIAEGYVTVTDGPNRSKLHTLEREYKQADDPLSDLYVTPVPQVGSEWFPSLEGGGGTTTRRGTGTTGEPPGTTETFPHQLNENTREPLREPPGKKKTGGSQVVPSENGTCSTCNFPLAGRPGSRRCDDLHALPPGGGNR